MQQPRKTPLSRLYQKLSGINRSIKEERLASPILSQLGQVSGGPSALVKAKKSPNNHQQESKKQGEVRVAAQLKPKNPPNEAKQKANMSTDPDAMFHQIQPSQKTEVNSSAPRQIIQNQRQMYEVNSNSGLNEQDTEGPSEYFVKTEDRFNEREIFDRGLQRSLHLFSKDRFAECLNELKSLLEDLQQVKQNPTLRSALLFNMACCQNRLQQLKLCMSCLKLSVEALDEENQQCLSP